MSQYTYTKTPADAGSLTEEIQESAITIALDYITLLGDQVSIFFKADLSSAEEEVLDDVILSHTGDPLPQNECHEVSVTNSEISTRLSYPVESITKWVKVRPRIIAGDVYINFVYFTTTSTGSLDAGNDSDYSILVSEDQTMTYVDYCPEHSYEIGGGTIEILESTSTGHCTLSFIGAPDYSVEHGGSVEFIRNKKLSVTRTSYSLLGIDPKLMRYHAEYPGVNKVRLKIVHAPGEKISMELLLMMSTSLDD